MRWYRIEQTFQGTQYRTVWLPLWQNIETTLVQLKNTSGDVRLVPGTTYVYGELIEGRVEATKTYII